MIITKLQGGLGNQLFQWATTFSLSKKYNTNYLFEFSYFYSNGRPFQLNKFPLIDVPLVTGAHNVKTIYDNFNFQEIEDNSFLVGYWQSEKYFKENSELIRQILSPTDEQKDYIKKNYPILDDECTSVHVRRGDYVGLQNFHPIQKLDYYEKAIELCGNKNILIFSDDIDWCKKNFKSQNIYYVDEKEEITTLHMMSLCKNNIIANSSFSWWGAWKGNQKERKVIAPKNWFGPEGPSNSSDIYCENWIVLDL